MELNTTERKLWDKFGEVVWTELQKQFNEISGEPDPWLIESMIDTTVDLYAYTYSNIPHDGISSVRAQEIISGIAYLLKKKLKDKIFEQ